MAVRCFARRHLVAPRRLAHEHVVSGQQSIGLLGPHVMARSFSEAVQNDGSNSKGKASASLAQALMSRAASTPLLRAPTSINRNASRNEKTAQLSSRRVEAEGSTSAERRKKARSTFSSPISERWQISAGNSQIPVAGIDLSQPHPYEAALLHELDLMKVEPTSRRREVIWQLYMGAIGAAERPDIVTSNAADSVHRSDALLDRRLHRRVLMAIAPYPIHITSKQREGELGDDDVSAAEMARLVKYRHEDNARLKSRRGIGTYLARAKFVLKQLHAVDPTELPRIVDINNVLEQLAPKGALAPMSAIWAELTGKKSPEATFSISQTKSSDTIQSEGAKARRPNRRTYIHLMTGITRHLASQLDRADKVEPDDRLKQRVVRGRADGGFKARDHPVFQARRQAILLASQRAASLLDDMVQREIPLDKIVCDLALRIMRMSGNMESFKILVREAYKVDLDNPEMASEGESSSFIGDVGSPDIHILNTIIMALGEHSTARAMVAAYEAMTKPLRSKAATTGVETSEPSTEASIAADPTVETDAQRAFGDKGIFSLEWQALTKWRDDPAIKEAVAQEEINESEVDLTATYAIWPNRKTFASLIQHLAQPPSLVQLLDASDESELGRSATSTSARKRAAKREAERKEREDGAYIPLACSYLREAAEVQEVEVTRLARELGVPLDNIDHLSQQIETIELEAEKQQREFTTHSSYLKIYHDTAEAEKLRPPEEANADGIIKKIFALIAEAVEGSDAAKPSSSKNLPTFTPPLLHIDHMLMQPLVSRASRERDTKQLAWLRHWSRKAIALHLAELRVLGVAIAQWDDEMQRLRQRRQSGVATGDAALDALDPVELRTLVDALRQQSRQVGQRMRNLAANHIDRITGRIAALQMQRRQRAQRRKARAEEAVLMEQQAAEAQREAQQLRQREREYQREENAARLLSEEVEEHDAHAALQPEPIRS